MESNLIYRDVTVALLKDEEYPCENDYDEGFMAALDKQSGLLKNIQHPHSLKNARKNARKRTRAI